MHKDSPGIHRVDIHTDWSPTFTGSLAEETEGNG